MRKSFFIAALVLSGCASTTPQVTIKAPEVSSNPPQKKEPDNFDKAGFILADGTRFVWNKATQAWEWIDSDQNKKRLQKAETTVVEMIKGAYEYGREEWNKK